MNRRELAGFSTIAASLVFAGVMLNADPLRAEEPATAAEARLLAAASSIGDRSLGKADAPVVVIEYASATCPHCAEFHERVLPEIRKDFIDAGKVRFIFREFPLDNLAMAAFVLARCVPEDKFFPTIDVMFKRQKLWMKTPKDELFRVMQLAGMDQAAFDACLKREDLAKGIYESAMKATNDFGVKGTPAIFVNGRKVDGYKEYPDIKAVIEQELAKSQ
jgi:protein-disulfide isomerase